MLFRFGGWGFAKKSLASGSRTWTKFFSSVEILRDANVSCGVWIVCHPSKVNLGCRTSLLVHCFLTQFFSSFLPSIEFIQK